MTWQAALSPMQGPRAAQGSGPADGQEQRRPQRPHMLQSIWFYLQGLQAAMPQPPILLPGMQYPDVSGMQHTHHFGAPVPCRRPLCTALPLSDWRRLTVASCHVGDCRLLLHLTAAAKSAGSEAWGPDVQGSLKVSQSDAA